jgi:hypothetical protein
MNRTPSTEILGKIITGVVIKHNQKGGEPSIQIHLVFSDGTSLEICLSYGALRFASGLDPGGLQRARRYISQPEGLMAIYDEAYLDQQGQIVEHQNPMCNELNGRT